MPVKAKGKGLGRRVPPDWKHVSKYPYRTVAPQTVAVVNKSLKLPYQMRPFYDQGREGACVGFSSSWMMSILNRRRYDARWLWNEAKKIDIWPDTNPGDDEGTSVRAALDVLRDQGHCRIYRGKGSPADVKEGVAENRWATTVDEVRTAIANGNPVVFGVNWYSAFDNPQKKNNRWWIGDGDLGYLRGGHGICGFQAWDRYQAFGWVNTWGLSYPLVLIPYMKVERLLQEDGECCLITDRV